MKILLVFTLIFITNFELQSQNKVINELQYKVSTLELKVKLLEKQIKSLQENFKMLNETFTSKENIENTNQNNNIDNVLHTNFGIQPTSTSDVKYTIVFRKANEEQFNQIMQILIKYDIKYYDYEISGTYTEKEHNSAYDILNSSSLNIINAASNRALGRYFLPGGFDAAIPEDKVITKQLKDGKIGKFYKLIEANDLINFLPKGVSYEVIKISN